MNKAAIFGPGQKAVMVNHASSHEDLSTAYSHGTIDKDRIDPKLIQQLNFATSMCLHLSEQIKDLQDENHGLRITLETHGIYS